MTLLRSQVTEVGTLFSSGPVVGPEKGVDHWMVERWMELNGGTLVFVPSEDSHSIVF